MVFMQVRNDNIIDVVRLISKILQAFGSISSSLKYMSPFPVFLHPICHSSHPVTSRVKQHDSIRMFDQNLYTVI